MDAGQLDQRIQIEQPVVAADALGQEVESWATVASPWAKVMETPGREFLSGDYRAEERTVFRIRWRALDSTARVQWGGRAWKIDSVTGTERERWAYLHCRATDGAN